MERASVAAGAHAAWAGGAALSCLPLFPIAIYLSFMPDAAELVTPVRLGRRTPFLGWVGRLWDEKSSQDRAAISGTLNLKIAEMGPCPEIGQVILRCIGISG